ncbi:hypothetical protein B0O99DRAFT_220624 [Bisporella sp. PMI_857]|nr:hypothetical protein B0O99DRAFT_220624 [Bisporella sp. PMI_857]
MPVIICSSFQKFLWSFLTTNVITMPSFVSLWLACCSVLRISAARTYTGSVSHGTASRQYDGVSSSVLSPTTTQASDYHELLRRQGFTHKTLIAAPDNTCGFFNGSSGASLSHASYPQIHISTNTFLQLGQPWGCSTGDCVFATPSPTSTTTYYSLNVNNSTQNLTQTASQTVGSVLCCDPITGCPSTPAPTACVDLDPNTNNFNKTCTEPCPNDPMTMKCTSGIYIFCNTVTFVAPSISAYFCNYVSHTQPLSASTAYPGLTNHSFTITTAAFPLPTSPTPASHPSNSTSLHTTSTVAPTVSKKKSSKGLIIGGVVGGLVLVAVLSGVVLLSKRWRERGTSYKEAGGASVATSPGVEEKGKGKA